MLFEITAVKVHCYLQVPKKFLDDFSEDDATTPSKSATQSEASEAAPKGHKSPRKQNAEVSPSKQFVIRLNRDEQEVDDEEIADNVEEGSSQESEEPLNVKAPVTMVVSTSPRGAKLSARSGCAEEEEPETVEEEQLGGVTQLETESADKNEALEIRDTDQVRTDRRPFCSIKFVVNPQGKIFCAQCCSLGNVVAHVGGGRACFTSPSSRGIARRLVERRSADSTGDCTSSSVHWTPRTRTRTFPCCLLQIVHIVMDIEGHPAQLDQTDAQNVETIYVRDPASLDVDVSDLRLGDAAALGVAQSDADVMLTQDVDFTDLALPRQPRGRRRGGKQKQTREKMKEKQASSKESGHVAQTESPFLHHLGQLIASCALRNQI